MFVAVAGCTCLGPYISPIVMLDGTSSELYLSMEVDITITLPFCELSMGYAHGISNGKSNGMWNGISNGISPGERTYQVNHNTHARYLGTGQFSFWWLLTFKYIRRTILYTIYIRATSRKHKVWLSHAPQHIVIAWAREKVRTFDWCMKHRTHPVSRRRARESRCSSIYTKTFHFKVLWVSEDRARNPKNFLVHNLVYM